MTHEVEITGFRGVKEKSFPQAFTAVDRPAAGVGWFRELSAAAAGR